MYNNSHILESKTESPKENKNVVLYGAVDVEIRTRTWQFQLEIMPGRNKNFANKNRCSVWGSQ